MSTAKATSAPVTTSRPYSAGAGRGTTPDRGYDPEKPREIMALLTRSPRSKERMKIEREHAGKQPALHPQAVHKSPAPGLYGL